MKRDSVILVHQLVTWNRAELTTPIGTLPAHLMLAVDQGLRFALGL
ncbi:MAG: type II toxin-antitoxin system PemK/MazF family toxin [Planctomycetota bacterium]